MKTTEMPMEEKQQPSESEKMGGNQFVQSEVLCVNVQHNSCPEEEGNHLCTEQTNYGVCINVQR